ncbi:MAG TPA: hypothetical protein VH164_07565 [Ktedonobacteraceae bacterium]|nr:hypothetical protein [Ktedonobacteraceae bacterium]
MPLTRITTSTTTQIKLGAGYIKQLSVANAGTTWTLQINDGPSLGPGSGGTGAGNTFYALFGGTPATMTTGLLNIQPIYFSNGCQIVTAGTAGELDVDWF